MISADSIEWIQKSNFKSYMKGPIVSSILGSILGEGADASTSLSR